MIRGGRFFKWSTKSYRYTCDVFRGEMSVEALPVCFIIYVTMTRGAVEGTFFRRALRCLYIYIYIPTRQRIVKKRDTIDMFIHLRYAFQSCACLDLFRTAPRICPLCVQTPAHAA